MASQPSLISASWRRGNQLERGSQADVILPVISGYVHTSVYNEERNLLRLRAWEQRILETNQAKELNPENVPLFGEPYKTNKGDELSNRIQRMLGSYEDVNNPYPFAIEPLPIPSYVTFSQSDQGHPNTDNPTKPPFHNQVQYMSTQSQTAPAANGFSSQPTRTSTASPHNQLGHSSTFSSVSLNHSRLSHSAHQQKSEAYSDITESVSLPQEMSSQSPDAKPVPFLRSSDQDNTTTDNKHTFDRHELQGSTDYPSECASAVDDSTVTLKPSPKDGSLHQANKGNALPSQTFPSLLSKQLSVVMTQKPTAYVRPMDGQDQVVSESPELKRSPQPYVPLPELINKSDLGRTKILPQFLETKTNEVQCVEDILREMTHSWPPLLTAIHTPNSGELSKSPFRAKEAECVSSCPGQKHYESPPTDPSHLLRQSSLLSFEAAQSRGIASASSSDSESSSRSESDSESTAEEPHQCPMSKKPDAPSVTHVDWQLGNWIRFSQQNSSTDSQSIAHASENPADKRPPSTQSSKDSGVEAVNPTSDCKPPIPSKQKEFTDSLGAAPQQCSEIPQDSYNQQSQISPSTDLKSCGRKPSCPTYSSKPAKAGCTEAALGLKRGDVVATRDKGPYFTDRPKVKMKTAHNKKSRDGGGDSKKDSKRTSKHTSLDKQKAGKECGHFPTCGVRYPNPCSCPAQSPAQPDQRSPAPAVRIRSSKSKTETVCQKGTKTPHKTTHKHPGKTGHTARGSRDLHKPPISLLVKIDLSLLSRVPRTSSDAKGPVLVIEQDGGGSGAPTVQKRTKTSKKCIPQNVEVDNATVPRKKPRLENKNTSSHVIKLESSGKSTEDRARKKAKKNPVPLQQPLTPKDNAKELKVHKRRTGETPQTGKKGTSEDSRKHKRSSGKLTEHVNCVKSQQKPPNSSFAVPSSSSSQSAKEALTSRPLLKFQDRQYPVKHYIKEAKKLKHKADVEPDKLSKALSYMEAAMYFVESGIAMEKDPQISMSSYTMFAETVELLKFVLKLKSPVDPSAPASEKDFLALCLKCQSLLHMAMFHHKYKTALKYSKTLTDHFKSSSQKTHSPSVVTSKVADTPSPMPNMPSPAITPSGSGPGSNQSGSGLLMEPACGTVAVPHAIEQVALTYVNITSLFLHAHDIWEQAEALAHKGSGMLTELDTAMGPLSLMSSMSSVVRYTRQGVHWLKLHSQKMK